MSSPRLPVPGGDDGDWGIILNDFLEVTLNGDGSLKTDAVTQAGGEMTSNKGAASGYAALDSSGLVPTDQLGTGSASSSNYLRGDGTWVAPNGGSSSLASDSDVSIVSPANNQTLTYNNVSGKWENLNPAVISVANKTGAVTLAESDVTNLTSDLAATEKTANKGIASGYAPLNSSTLVPTANLGTGTPSSSNYLRGDGTWTATPAAPVISVANKTGAVTLVEGDVTNLTSDLAATEKTANKGIASGYAPLNSSTLVPTANLGSGAPSSGNYLRGDGTWTAAPVVTVAGRTGAITLAESDVTNLTTDLSSKLTASNNLSDVASATTARTNLAAAASLVPTAIQTAAYTPAVNDLAKFDISGGSVTTQTLPNAPADKSFYAAKIIKTSGTNTVVLNTQGSDVINVSSGSTSYTLKLLNQSVLLQYQSTGNIWNILADDLPLSQLDSRYSLAGTTAVITDGTTDGGTITVGTTTPPSPGPRDFWIDPAVSPQATDISGVIAVSTVQAAGDLIVGNASATIERLPIGSPGQILTVGGSDPSGLEWAPASSPNVVRGLYLKSSSAVTPSATLSTYGTTQTVGLDSSTTSMVPFGILWVSTGVGSETITLQGTATYQDATTASGSVTITTNTNSAFTATNLSGLWQDGKYIVSIGFHAKSTINSSTASIAITVFGIST